MKVWKRTEIISILIAVLVLVVITTAFTQTWRSARVDREREIRLRALLESINSLVSYVKDAETGQRGYLLTHNSKYLRPYLTASEIVPAEITRLRQMLPQDAETERFLSLVGAKMAELSQTIDVRDKASSEKALANMMTDRGMLEMDALQASAQRITTRLYEELATIAEHRRERSAVLGYVNIGGGFVLLGLLVLSAMTIQKSARRREHLIDLLREDERRLRDMSEKATDAEAAMRDILESITDGFISLDRHFEICYVNSACERIFGRSKNDLHGKNFWAEFPDDDLPEVRARYKQVVSTKLPLTFEIFSEKRKTWWEESIYPAKADGLSVYLRDVTERKRMEERSRHTQKLESLGVLAGGIAHDFNNLLTAILGGASLLQEELPPDSPVAGHVKIVMNASECAAQLTRQMLAYSGRGRFVVEHLELSNQVREITQLLEASISRDVELVLNLESPGAFVEADAGQIQQLVMNLVINGAEAIEDGPGTVVVSTRVEELDSEYVRDNMAGDSILPGRYVLLEVHDTGKGMDDQTLLRIFDPFFTTKFTGRGLGLAAVIGIVRGHRGAIKVYSHPGQGTTFKVYFPVAVDQAHAPISVTKAGSLRGTETVLIVDDEESVQRLARVALEKYGYRVLEARNGREAVELYEREHAFISLVLLDMTMPVMSGEETLRRLKDIRSDVLVIVSSGYNEIEALRRFGQGVLGFLQKPYRANTLAEKIRSALTTRNSAVT